MYIDEIDKLADKTLVVDKINKIKFGTDIQSYKTGSVNGVKTRIKLFAEGVEEVIDGR